MVKYKGKARKPKNLFQLGQQLKKAHDVKVKKAVSERKREEVQKILDAKRRESGFRVRYTATENILIVGDGNCSFGRALIRYFRKRIVEARERLRIAQIRQSSKKIRNELIAEYEKLGAPIPEDIYNVAMTAAKAELNSKSTVTTEYGFPFDSVLDAECPEDAEAVESLNCNYKRKALTLRNCGMRVLVTCYDTQEIALKKYDDLPEILEEIHSAGARVVFGMDALSMQSSLSEAGLVPTTRFDHIVFNFPHVGSGNQVLEESIQENQGLILGFLANAMPLLRNPLKYAAPPKPFYMRRGAASVDVGDHVVNFSLDLQDFEEESSQNYEKKVPESDDNEEDDEDNDEDVSHSDDAEDEDEMSMEELNALMGPTPVHLTNEQIVKRLQDNYLQSNNNESTKKSSLYVDRGGEIHVTLKLGEPYDSWKIGKVGDRLNDSQRKAQADKETIDCVYPGEYDSKFPKLDLIRGVPFVPSAFDGYTHRRTIGFKHALSADANQDIGKGSRTYIFVRSMKKLKGNSLDADDDDDDDNRQLAGKIKQQKLLKNLKPKQRKARSGRKQRINAARKR